MNILYISDLNGKKSEGPNKSVPNQIKAQTKYDNVLWLNINDTPKNTWCVDINFINCSNVKKISIADLPKPFDKPDLVVFQGLYTFHFCMIAKQLIKINVPYIIIPRSSLTISAQRSKAVKKKIGNMIFFKEFIKNAAAIQYLTEEEYKSSGDSWNTNALIIPNGADKKSITKVWKSNEALKGVFIGRIDIYQKGMDLLIKACSVLKSDMKTSGCKINIYGPDQNGSKDVINKLISKNELGDFIYVSDAIFDDEKEAVLLDSDFFILTSRFEGHSMALIEALSYGLPCFVTTGTNMAHEISVADAGWTAEINMDSIARAFRVLLNDKDNFAKKSRNALELSKRYDWNELALLSNIKYKALLR